jgi:hypothetical protein
LDLSKLEGLCETCYSLRKCPKCMTLYCAGDLLVKCQHCVRWFHARCEDLHNEDQVEEASENSFRCSYCRPKMNSSCKSFELLTLNEWLFQMTPTRH